MAKAKRSTTRLRSAPERPAAPKQEPAGSAADDQISSSTLSLHELFQQQARQLLDRVDLDEQQRQNILIAMSCPCCGAAAMSYTAKLKR